VRQGKVAAAAGELAGCGGLIDEGSCAARLGGEEPQQPGGGVGRFFHQVVRDHEGAGVDEGVPRDAVLHFQLDQGVERGAGGFAQHAGPQRS